ncbi:MAG: NADP-dependent oxidoreductase [Sneathiellaceae bacterium]
MTTNRQWRLKWHPEGMPSAADFDLVEAPQRAPGEGEVATRALSLSIDPYMRGRIAQAKSYAAGVQVGDVMVGGAVAQVTDSRFPGLEAGDIVETMGHGWQTHATLKGKGLRRLDRTSGPFSKLPLSYANGILGMPGATAYFALLDQGRPKAGETVVVSAASGAVGQIVGQIARIKGCRAIAIAGSEEKLAYCRELGFDAGINYKTTKDLAADLKAACPEGIDIYFDNVGGEIHDTCMQQINLHARIIICGVISVYNSIGKPDVGPRNLRNLLINRAVMSGFLFTDYADRMDEAVRDLSGWLLDGSMTYREDVVEGFEAMPDTLARVLQGGNFGKQIVHVADPD